MSLADDFADMFGSVLTVQPGSLDAGGDFIASGSTFAVKCYIEGGHSRRVDSGGGRETVASVMVVVDGVYGLTLTDHLYILPPPYPSAGHLIAAVMVDIPNNEEGADHEELMFP